MFSCLLTRQSCGLETCSLGSKMGSWGFSGVSDSSWQIGRSRQPHLERLPCECMFPFPPEYVDHLKDEGRVCKIIDRVQNYLQDKGTTEEVCRIYLRCILHTYYKFDYKAHQRQQGPAGDSKVGQPLGQQSPPPAVLALPRVFALCSCTYRFCAWGITPWMRRCFSCPK